MAHHHLSAEIYQRLLDDACDREAFWAIAEQHLRAVCPACDEEHLSVLGEAIGRLELEDDELTHYQKAFALGTGLNPERARHFAEVEAGELLEMPAAERQRCLEDEEMHYRSPLLVAALLERCQALVQEDPAAARVVADTAVAVAYRIEADAYGRDVTLEALARAKAHLGNTTRAAGQLKAAERYLTVAMSWLSDIERQDPRVEAEIRSLMGSLLTDQRRFKLAVEQLERARACSREAADPVLEARVLIQLGTVHDYCNDADSAIQAAQEALRLLAPEDELDLELAARHNLVLYYCLASQYDKAASTLAEGWEQYDEVEVGSWELRRRWLEGRVAQGKGDERLAEAAFREVRTEAIERGVGYDAAMVSLDLAMLLHDQGRCREVKELAEELLSVLEDQNVHREALTALTLFREAASDETLTRELLESLRTYLELAQRDPELSFEYFHEN